MQKSRQQGYALDFDEYLKGTMAVAAPIRAGKRLIGVVWVVCFTSAMDDAKVAEIIEQVTNTTKLISRAIQSADSPDLLRQRRGNDESHSSGAG